MVDSIANLHSKYTNEVVPAIMKEFSFQNIMEVPRLQKIVLSMGLGEAVQNSKVIDSALDELSVMCGQRAVMTRARKSIAGFKLREGAPIGAMVTLRRQRMWEFLERLFSLALPRVRDFRGVSPKAFDGRGNYSLGVTEQIIFPEIDYDKILKVRGLNISIVTTAQNDAVGRSLLTHLGMPFRK